VVDVDCAVGSAPCLTAVDDRGYEIDEAEVAYWGRCPDCVAQSRAASHANLPPTGGPLRSQRRNARAGAPTNPSTDREHNPSD
jgi:Fur family ferric uptake transcriptional regulator